MELGGKAVTVGWADGVSSDKINEWRENAVDAVKDEMERVMQETTSQEYSQLMRKVPLPRCSYSLSLIPFSILIASRSS